MKVCSEIVKSSGVQFGTSGARGLVEQFSSEVCAAFTAAFIDAMKKTFEFKRISIGIDRRPSSPAMAEACAQCAMALGFEVDYCGVLPTPALAYQSMQAKQPAIMVTGSHIPFDRNGIKFYRPDGEITKADEQSITSSEVMLPAIDHSTKLNVNSTASDLYKERYDSVFSSEFLNGKRVGIYEHSSAGRDIYAELFKKLGAEVISLGRSEEFVPIDTEAVRAEDILQGKIWAKEHQLDFLFSTDGDGDRPLIADERGSWLRGDIVGLLTAKYLKIEALAVPVSCNTAIEDSNLFKKVLRTRIGSPYVIEGMEQLSDEFERIAGFEANGGFLLGSTIDLRSGELKALPTRDALLPVFALMALSVESCKTLSVLVSETPQRFTASDRIQNFPTENSRSLIAKWSDNTDQALGDLNIVGRFVLAVDETDGLRLTLDNGDIVHLRPSGNAPELRCYAESSLPENAERIVDNSLATIAEIKI